MASKEGRKRRVLTLEKKLEVIQELKDGKSQRLLHILRYGHFLVMGNPWTHAARIIDILLYGKHVRICSKFSVKWRQAITIKVDFFMQ